MLPFFLIKKTFILPIGSFKIRGVLNQIRKLQEKHGGNCNWITMSSGNYGKAFAHCVGKLPGKSVCVMPKSAPSHTVESIEVKISHPDEKMYIYIYIFY